MILHLFSQSQALLAGGDKNISPNLNISIFLFSLPKAQQFSFVYYTQNIHPSFFAHLLPSQFLLKFRLLISTNGCCVILPTFSLFFCLLICLSVFRVSIFFSLLVNQFAPMDSLPLFTIFICIECHNQYFFTFS